MSTEVKSGFFSKESFNSVFILFGVCFGIFFLIRAVDYADDYFVSRKRQKEHCEISCLPYKMLDYSKSYCECDATRILKY